MSDPNPYVAPIQVATVGKLRRALGRFTIDDQVLPAVVVTGGMRYQIDRITYDPSARTCDVHMRPS